MFRVQGIDLNVCFSYLFSQYLGIKLNRTTFDTTLIWKIMTWLRSTACHIFSKTFVSGTY